MPSEIFAGIGALKAAMDIVKGIHEASAAHVRDTLAIEIQEKLIAAYTSHLALHEQVRELEEEMTRLKTWEGEKQRYELADFGGGTFAYRIKETERGGEPAHRICAACYQSGKKSILQFLHKTAFHQELYFCPTCKTEFQFGTPRADHYSSGAGGSWSA